VRRDLIAVGVTALLLGALGGVVVVVASVSRDRLLDGWVLAVGGLLLFVLVRGTTVAGGERSGSGFDAALVRRPPRAMRPAELESLERNVVLAAGSAFDLHARLRPLLREVAADRLATGRGLELDGRSGEVLEALGPELWEIVRADRPAPIERFAPGLAVGRLSEHVRTLESL
jgi:hypothetical protein